MYPFPIRFKSLSSSEIISNGLHCDKGTIEDGGYTVIGKLVVVNVRINITQTINPKTEINITGFPRAKIISSNTVPVSCNQSFYRCYCTSNADELRIVCALNDITEPNTRLILGCAYVTI